MAQTDNRLEFDSRDEEDVISRLYPMRKARVMNPGNVYYIPVSSFPIPAAECDRLNQFLGELCRRYEDLTERPLFSYLALLNSVLNDDVLRMVVTKMFDWRPMQALALIPDLPPPHMLSEQERLSLQEDFSMERLHQAAPLMTRISRKAAVKPAYTALLGAGGSAFYLSALDDRQFFRMTREVFGARVTDRLFRALPLFVPLFGTRSFQDVSEAEVVTWLTSFEIYLGESLEDRGIVIVSGIDLDCLIEQLLEALPAAGIERQAEALRW